MTFTATTKQDFLLKAAYCSQSAFAAEVNHKTREVVVRFDPARWKTICDFCTRKSLLKQTVSRNQTVEFQFALSTQHDENRGE